MTRRRRAPIPTDPISFALGLGFVALGGGLSMVGVEVPVGAGLRWVGAIVLWVLGAVLVVVSKAGRPAADDTDRRGVTTVRPGAQ